MRLRLRVSPRRVSTIRVFRLDSIAVVLVDLEGRCVRLALRLLCRRQVMLRRLHHLHLHLLLFPRPFYRRHRRLGLRLWCLRRQSPVRQAVALSPTRQQPL